MQSECANVQANLSLLRAQMSEGIIFTLWFDLFYRMKILAKRCMAIMQEMPCVTAHPLMVVITNISK